MRFGNAIGISGSGSRAKSRFHDERYRELMQRECGVLVCENETKWQHLRPSPDVFRFAQADEMFAWAIVQRHRSSAATRSCGSPRSGCPSG